MHYGDTTSLCLYMKSNLSGLGVIKHTSKCTEIQRCASNMLPPLLKPHSYNEQQDKSLKLCNKPSLSRMARHNHHNAKVQGTMVLRMLDPLVGKPFL